MMQGKYDTQLSAVEFDYLFHLASCDEWLAGLLNLHKGAQGRGAVIRLSRAEIEQLRDYLTTKLALVGFDENYAPNEQGRILEQLIDRFYVLKNE